MGLSPKWEKEYIKASNKVQELLDEINQLEENQDKTEFLKELEITLNNFIKLRNIVIKNNQKKYIN